MAEPITQVLGIVSIKPRGEYNSETAYEKLNVVTYQGSSYCAKTNTQGNLPTDTNFWDLMVEKGEKGDTGDNGYTPVKGVDYYTSEDKEELELTLKSDVANEVSEQLGELVSTTPLAVSSTSEMTDITRIYVNTTDGYWYYYNGTNWVQGGIYQATEFNELITTNNIPLTITGYIRATNGTLSATNGFISSDFIEVNENQYIQAYLYQATNVIGLVSFYDENKAFIKSYWGEDASSSGFINISQNIPSNCKYIRISTKNETGAYGNVCLNAINYINKINNDVEQKTKILINNTGYLKPNGTVSSTNGFKYSDYNEVKFGQKIKGYMKQVSSQALALVCFYTEEKNLISSYVGDGTEETKFINIDIDVPYNCKYVRVSTVSTENEYYAFVVTNSKNWLNTINRIIDETKDVYYVDKTATPSGNIFNSLIDCLKHIELKNYDYPVNVYIKGGTYDIFDELGGVEFLQSITSSDTAYTINQPWLYNVNLIGLGNVKLEYKPTLQQTTDYPLGEGLISVLNVRGNVNIENIDIECQYCRYAIHDETGGEIKYYNTYHNYKNVNCNMIKKSSASSGGHTIGLGFDNGQSYLFENCKLYNNNNDTSTNCPLFIHNRNSYGGNFTIKDSIFESVGTNSLLLSNVGNQDKTNVNISNSYFNKQIFIRSENQQDVANCFQIYMNNCNSITISESSHITSNPYQAIIKNTI